MVFLVNTVAFCVACQHSKQELLGLATSVSEVFWCLWILVCLQMVTSFFEALLNGSQAHPHLWMYFVQQSRPLGTESDAVFRTCAKGGAATSVILIDSKAGLTCVCKVYVYCIEIQISISRHIGTRDQRLAEANKVNAAKRQ